MEQASGQPAHPVVLVTKLVGLGDVTPRNASIWLRAAGMTPASVAKKDLAAKWNLTVRHVHNVHRGVALRLPAPGAPAPQAEVPSGVALDAALAAVHAQLDVGDHDLRRDSVRALHTLAAQMRGIPVSRSSAHPQGGPARSRGYRLRAHLKKHIERLSSDEVARYPRVVPRRWSAVARRPHGPTRFRPPHRQPAPAQALQRPYPAARSTRRCCLRRSCS